jgi:mannose-6-phosphate isomerase-like protein (cupin superfamily)
MKTKMPLYKIDWNDIPWESPMEGVKCKTYTYGNKQIRLIEYSKEMQAHFCEKGHYGLILDGEIEIEYDNKKIIYKNGNGVFIPDGLEHRHKGRVITETVRVIFIEDV